MQVNPTIINAIIAEIESQRNQALARSAQKAGENADLDAQLQMAKATIGELEAKIREYETSGSRSEPPQADAA